ncbi:VCBS domain-containing protein [Methylorubrum extorquens]|uniref:VCBS domain-containing protein n=1 Tax=Methylorubrum extorquens TaxID=408 RepID=UPI000158F50F|nr:VCBS domain-containing protein [Methylorubrum extorquens]ABY28576.1 outer membrane adhesin like protein [Methylorubrum extorquens PA1]WIU39957.1 VCBS domain-containing protein [Methylorubrum extorquens]
MATVSNGAATSVSNTPQAKDDYVTTAEDVGTKINVLANDSGGTAKSLYSISQGDPLAVAKTATSSLGATIYITSDGQVYYDPASATRIQALAQGETAVDTFVYEERLGNGTISTATVYVTVKGTNDGPILAADTATHAMTEIAGATSGSGTETASTTLTFTDRDLSDTHTVSYGAPSVTWTGGAHIPADTAAALASALTLTKMDSTGSGTGSVKVDFALADKLADFLGVHETLTVTYQITVRDSQGASSVQPVTLTLTGTNDDALITAATAGSDRGTVTEDGNVAAEGVLSFTDADLNDAHTVSVMPSGAALGTLTVNKTADLNGVGSVSWSYTVDSTKVQYLAEGETKVESFQILLSDGTSTVSKTVSITITGTNDAPVVTPASVGDSAGTATPLLETDAGLATSGTLTVIDLDVVDQVSVAVSGVTHSGPTGSLTNAELLSYFHITPGTIVDGRHTSGQFTWTFNSGAQAFDFLAQSEVLELQYRITPDDGHAPTGTGDGVVTIRIQGTNDAAVIGGAAAGAVTEDAVTTTSGQLTITDVDTGEAHFQAITAGALTKTYGSFTFNETTGAWSYALDHAKADSLAKDQVVHDTLNVTSFDGTDTQLIDVTITGTNDAATIVASGGDHGNVTEDTPGQGLTQGSLSVQDVDAGENRFQAVAAGALEGQYGSFTFDADTGAWKYTLDHAKADKLTGTDVKHDTLTVTSFDGTDTHVIDATVYGTNDAAVIGGAAAGAVTEDAVTTTSGQLTITDVDTGEAHFQAITAGALTKTYGSFTFNETTGAWSYALDHAKADSLAKDQVVHDTLNVTSFDGTDTQLIDVTITGTNDAATIVASGGDHGNVTEDTPGQGLTQGSLSVQDVDAGENRFQAVAAGALEGQYGSFTFDADTGAWKYTLDHAKADKLTGTDVKHDTLTVTSFDGTDTHVIDATVYGTNDAAVIGGAAAGAVTEDAVTTTSGQLTITDVDTGEAHFQAITAGALTKTYGSFTFNETTGAWSYALDHAKADSLAKDQVVHDTLNVTSFDGTDTQLIDVTITGTNDGLTPNLVLNFDNISSGPVPDGYGGLNWNSNGSFYSGTADILNTGYGYGNGDNDSFVFNGWAGKYSSITKTNGGTFSVSGLDIADSTYAHFSDTPNDANTVQFVGMKNGAQTYSKLVSLSNDHFDHVDLDFSGIDQFQINVVGGQQSGLGVSNTGWWAIDNLGLII